MVSSSVNPFSERRGFFELSTSAKVSHQVLGLKRIRSFGYRDRAPPAANADLTTTKTIAAVLRGEIVHRAY